MNRRPGTPFAASRPGPSDGEFIPTRPANDYQLATCSGTADSSFKPVPLCSLLSARIIPPKWRTEFATPAARIRPLPEAMNSGWAGGHPIHDFSVTRSDQAASHRRERATYPPVRHPLVRTTGQWPPGALPRAHASTSRECRRGRRALLKELLITYQPAVPLSPRVEGSDLVSGTTAASCTRQRLHSTATSASSSGRRVGTRQESPSRAASRRSRRPDPPVSEDVEHDTVRPEIHLDVRTLVMAPRGLLDVVAPLGAGAQLVEDCLETLDSKPMW